MAYELEKSIGFKINQTANKPNNKFTQLLKHMILHLNKGQL